MKSLEVALRGVREQGRKALVPYFMAGLSEDWIDHVQAAIQAGADAVEIGVPFSDPLMDGVVIQEAGLASLNRGTSLVSVCQELAGVTLGVPLVVMTYYNLFHHEGEARAAGRLAEAGIRGAIIPDLTLEESSSWRAVCDSEDIANITIVAPSSPPARVAQLAGASEGFCYASARMAVTGAASDEGEGPRVVRAIRDISNIPTYIGIGITNPEQAAHAAQAADGVIVGSTLVKAIFDGATPSDTERLIGTFRAAIN